MNHCQLILREIKFHSRRSLLALLAVTIAAGVLASAFTLLSFHDLAERRLLAARQQQTEEAGALLRDEMRKATLKLSFNLLILPEEVDLKEWHVDQESDLTLPDDYGDRLANSDTVTVRHILPIIQKRLVWPETQRNIILIGTRGEVPKMFKNPRNPLVQPVPPGTIVLGSYLHRPMDLKEGDAVDFMGKTLTVHRLHDERGSADDITVWINLQDAQELLGMEGKISSLVALECLCAAGPDGLAKVREEVAGILPGTQVVEMGTKVLARAEARLQANAETFRQLEAETQKQQQLAQRREAMAAVWVALVILLCGGWIALINIHDVRERRGEIAMLRSVGMRTLGLLRLFLGRALIIGLLGGSLGYLVSAVLCSLMLRGVSALSPDDLSNVWKLSTVLISMGGAVLLMIPASWIPALMAARTDPADVLREFE